MEINTTRTPLLYFTASIAVSTFLSPVHQLRTKKSKKSPYIASLIDFMSSCVEVL